MPHATAPPPGFQAFILCGPGASLNTFTSNPKDFPKALVPVANRPMVWYPLDWCYRMGITDIILVTPPEAQEAIEAALSQNPHLTSLPAPKPDILAPQSLTQTTGTAEIFRTPEVQAAITSDFVIVPCDLVSELDGTSLIDTWMLHESGFGGATGGIVNAKETPIGLGGEKIGRRGGLGVWYQTKGETSTKNEETDFIATTPLPEPLVPPSTDSLNRDVAKLVLSMPTAALKDVTEDRKCLPIRHALIRTHGRIRMLTTYRDSHIYFLPYWVKEMIARNEKFESFSEDVLGWWAKAGWQEGLGDKLGLKEILHTDKCSPGDEAMDASQILDEQVDLTSMISTWSPEEKREPSPLSSVRSFASRVKAPDASDEPASLEKDSYTVPPVLAYVQPSEPSAPLIRRVDTAQLLLSVSLRLAKIPSLEECRANGVTPSPLAHTSKIAHRENIPQRCRVEAENSLLAENVTVEEKTNIKESIIGANCKIGSGARLMRCLLMDGAEVGENCQLTGCILGRRCRIEGSASTKDGDRTVLKDCQVQEGQVIEWGTQGTNESYMRFEGLSEEEEDVNSDDMEPIEALESSEGVSLR